MAVAAYASWVSLTHVLENLHYRAPFHLPLWDLKQIEALQENVHFMLEFVELHSGNKNPATEGLWRQMAEVAFEAEEKIDFHVVSQLNMRFQGETQETDLSSFLEDMEKLISKIDFIKQKLPSITEGQIGLVAKQPSASVPADGSAATTHTSGKNVVGIDEHVVRIMDQLTRDESNLQTLPIVGMGGIGKTTLARTVFDHSYVVNYFDMRMWITVSQKYSVDQILMGLLEGRADRGTSESLAELGGRLYKNLFGRRYLIVMDDVWTIKAWDDLKRFFPSNGVGRVMLTTRLANVASCLGSLNPYPLSFLDEDKSWDLFCQITFGHLGCPYVELEKIGKDIAKSCRGLPLEIVIIGCLLAKSHMTPEYWKSVAEDITSFGNLEDDEHCLKVLYLSYNSLPIYLKPCFLYMRVYLEDASIHGFELTDFWIVEGFIKLSSDKSLEETAQQYLKDLIDRNLIYCRSTDADVYGIHDLLLDLCLRESNKECFLRSPKVQSVFPNSEYRICFFCGRPVRDEGINLGELIVVYPSSAKSGSFVCDACKVIYSHITRLRLVRTMDGYCHDSWEEIEQPTQVRYALIYFFNELKFISLHLLWNLQLLYIYSFNSSPIHLPLQIWEMPQLRRIVASTEGLLPDPIATHFGGEDFIVLKHLQLLSHVRNFKCTKEILSRVPDLKELRIGYRNESEGDMNQQSDHSLYNLEQLHKLEILHISGASENITFPISLKKLVLMNCKMAWEDMSKIGSLASLERLELVGGIEGSEWNPNEGEFLRLKWLKIESTELVYWRADETHFPNLEELRLCDLYSLEEIPSGIGDIPTLQFVALEGCNDSVINLGKQMWEEQHSMGNESFKMYIDSKKYEMEDEDSDS